MPDQSTESTLSELRGKTLTGWEEIRQALVVVDSLPEEQRSGARVEVYECSKESSVKVSFTSLPELDKWLKMRFRKQLLKGEEESHSRQLDVLSEVHGQVIYVIFSIGILAIDCIAIIGPLTLLSDTSSV